MVSALVGPALMGQAHHRPGAHEVPTQGRKGTRGWDTQRGCPRASGVSAALRHEEPDRVPIDLGGFQTGIHKKAYEALIEHLGLDEPSGPGPVQQLAGPSRPCSSGSTSTSATSARTARTASRAASRSTSATAACGTTCATSSASSGPCPTTSRSTWTSPTIRWPTPRSQDIEDYPFPERRRPDAGSPACASRRCACGETRPTPSRPASAAWSTRSAGTCAAWNGGSWT